MTKRTATTAAIILSIAAAGAPAASAMPIGYSTTGRQAPTSVYDRPDKSMIPVSPPAAESAGNDRVAALSALNDPQLRAAFDVAVPAANKASASARVHAAPSGFDWGDAGIGAAGGIGILMLATGGGLVAVRMRRDHLDPATR